MGVALGVLEHEAASLGAAPSREEGALEERGWKNGVRQRAAAPSGTGWGGPETWFRVWQVPAGVERLGLLA